MTTTEGMILPKEVVERVNAELLKAILETPEYIEKIIKQLTSEIPRDNSSFGYSDPDRNYSFFDRILRRELRSMVEKSVIQQLRAKYQDVVDREAAKVVDAHEKLEGSLAGAFAKMISEDFKVHVNVQFEIKNERSRD